MNIAVIGGGSLGLLLSSYLTENHKVTLYVRRAEQRDLILTKGISLKKNGTTKLAKVACALIDDLDEHDVYFICVKQTHIDRLLPALERLPETSKIVFLQNGMGHINKIDRLRAEVYVGVVEHGATRTSDREVSHLGVGKIKISPFKTTKNETALLEANLDERDFPVETVDDWEALLKAKLLINAVINPLTALFDVHNGAIVENAHIKHLAQKLTEETSQVLGFHYDEAWQHVMRVAENTKENTSSMRADILNRRETEIDAISGYLLQQGNERDIPYTSFIYEAILALEERGK